MSSVSVVLPVYKVEPYITHTMQSLLNQTCKDFEVILVDDGSPDRSIEAALSVLDGSSIAYQVLRQSNSGQGIARDVGVAAAKGEWIFFLDSDDVIQPDTLEVLLELTKADPETDIVYTGFQYVHEDVFRPGGDTGVVRVYDRKQMLDGFLTREKVVLVPGTMYRKRFLEENNIRHTGIRWSEDQLFMWNVLSCVNRAVYTSRVLYNYYRHPGSVMSATPASKILDAYGVWKEAVPKLGDENTKKYALSRWVLGCIREYARRSDFQQWKQLAEQMDVPIHIRQLRSFPSKKIRLVAAFGGNLKRLYLLLRAL